MIVQYPVARCLLGSKPYLSRHRHNLPLGVHGNFSAFRGKRVEAVCYRPMMRSIDLYECGQLLGIFVVELWAPNGVSLRVDPADFTQNEDIYRSRDHTALKRCRFNLHILHAQGQVLNSHILNAHHRLTRFHTILQNDAQEPHVGLVATVDKGIRGSDDALYTASVVK